MTRLSDFGDNPHAGVNPNDDHDWGGYRWPGGVPAELLGTASYGGVTAVVRKELVELFSLAFRIAKDVHHYTIWTHNPNGNGEPWGPWGYENRCISGTSTASNHSKGKATDWNAPNNPYATGDRWETNFPVAMVAHLESIGLYWGGRYGDTMHWEYAYSPADIAHYVAKAKAIIAAAAPPPPKPPDPNGWLTVSAEQNIIASIDSLRDALKTAGANLPADVWGKGITSTKAGGHADEILAATAQGVRDAGRQLTAAAGGTAKEGRYCVVIDDSTGAWYAVAPGTFWHLPDGKYVQLGRAVGLLDGDAQHTDAAGIKRVREMALAGAGPLWVKPPAAKK